ncbi:prenyltransferase/squalene oxidase repeat-containing protein [Kitasatospora sp. NPDC101235]|uniref:prenyltransferase/squalene oxidase repeat-containing protein n=1 Tax=Kitasatospora sp. NPDC101235 TaxID=3364101 RepID=UPI0038239CA8
MSAADAQTMTTAFDTEAAELLAAAAADTSGLVAPSVYDTARLVSLAPWLDGHRARLDYLLTEQQPDGGWGAPDGYAVVPTLSAVEALLAEFARATTDGDDATTDAVARGLAFLRDQFAMGEQLEVPDTIGVEFVAPALLEDINTRLARLPADAPGKLAAWAGVTLSSRSSELDPTLLTAVREIVRETPLSSKLWHTLEAMGLECHTRVKPHNGSVGCSPAATAAWLAGTGQRDAEAVEYLRSVQERFGGPVPSITPITYFEHAWVLNSFAVSGLEYQAPAVMLDSLESGLTEEGIPAAAGLPVDSDDTAAALFALAQHGRGRRPDALMHFQRDGYFACFGTERTPSTSTNAHILEALGYHVAQHPQDAGRYGAAIRMITAWLLETQLPDGSWIDKWHASPSYATACCALALAHFGGPGTADAVRRSVDWALETQRRDGSWGRWTGTTEETAYMVQVLLRTDALTGGREDLARATARAAARGCATLLAHDDPQSYPGLWHDKDIYAPVTVIRAARLAALALGRRLPVDLRDAR